MTRRSVPALRSLRRRAAPVHRDFRPIEGRARRIRRLPNAALDPAGARVRAHADRPSSPLLSPSRPANSRPREEAPRSAFRGDAEARTRRQSTSVYGGSPDEHRPMSYLTDLTVALQVRKPSAAPHLAADEPPLVRSEARNARRSV